MNDLLQLKGHFESRKNSSQYGQRKLPGSNNKVTKEKIADLIKQINAVINFWKKDTLLNKKLITVYYNRIVAKSNRIQELFSSKTDSIVGAKFSEDKKPKHIITYCISISEMQSAIMKLSKCIEILDLNKWTFVENSELNEINTKKIGTGSIISKTSFINTIVDCFYIEKIDLDQETKDYSDSAIVTLYDTGIETRKILEKLGIDYTKGKIIDDFTLYLSPEQYAKLQSKAPYLIAMSVVDISKLEPEDIFSTDYTSDRKIKMPAGEPVIGVIDTAFDNQVYFSPWVEYKNLLSADIPQNSIEDVLHGTYVSSIIVDGPALNPKLDDGCGNFRVRHFCVGTAKAFSIFTILRTLPTLIKENPDIKVWNLSLGSIYEIEKNFISPVAYLLDSLQYKYDVIFIVAGTNKDTEFNQRLIGSPADSINSLVVNSVSFEKKSATYSRSGPVLSFYKKPDISYYGGDEDKKITVYNSLKGDVLKSGTSFAAPWIARKMSYLIQVIGLPREVAKALVIDSAIEWKGNENISDSIGYGIVPVHINDILKSKNDEIKFVIFGINDNYKTYNNNLPVPLDKEAFPFIAKATLCYFPNCSRNQGVDYTNTELDFQFGRVTKSGIKPINGNLQSAEESSAFITEEDARNSYRKWDNVKIVREELKSRHIPKKKYQSNFWGICITAKERSTKVSRGKIKFGLVITLKEINGINRIDEFIQRCTFSQWIVNRINVENKLDVFVKAEEDLIFD